MEKHLQVHQQQQLELPPGYMFQPTDVEIITYYLVPKVLNKPFDTRVIGEVNLNKSEPWEIIKKENMEDKDQYFFSKKDLKYPTGIRANRATITDYWKATGKDKEIAEPSSMSLIGMIKTLVFYKGRAPMGEKTNLVMHEYRLESGKQPKPGLNTDIIDAASINASSQAEHVVCKIFHKSTGLKKVVMPSYNMPMSMGAKQQQGILESNYFTSLMEYDTSSSLVPPSTLPATSSYQLQVTGADSSVMGTVMPPMMSNHYFGDHHQMMAAPPQSSVSFYLQHHQQMMQMGVDQSFMAGVDHGSGPSSIVSQEDAVTGISNNAHGDEVASTFDEISSVNMGMDGMWRY